jgi:hypothetical protein
VEQQQKYNRLRKTAECLPWALYLAPLRVRRSCPARLVHGNRLTLLDDCGDRTGTECRELAYAC